MGHILLEIFHEIVVFGIGGHVSGDSACFFPQGRAIGVPILRDLKSEPAWQASDLGMPLPDTRHACSVCLPTWDSIIGYEEGLTKVTRRMRCGYPRFFKHAAVGRLFDEATKALAEPGKKVVVFPNREAAQRAQRFVEKRTGSASRIASYDALQALVVTEEDYAVAMEYWRYTGEIISSRQAEHICHGYDAREYKAKRLRKRLAQMGDVKPSDVYLYENGMSGIFAVYRAIQAMRPGMKTLQLEFPYVDALKIQNHFGNGVVFLNEAAGESLEEALRRIRQGEFAAVFCEAPSNPLLRVADLPQIYEACRDGGVPLVVDDTICSIANVKVDQYADIVTSSLTKWISGKGDVMAGQVTLVAGSAFHSDLQEFFDNDCPDGSRLYASDARVLARNISRFSERMQKANENGEKLADFLLQHPAVAEVFYPKYTSHENYEAIRRPDGGYGGLISFVLKNKKKTAKFYDSLELSKGPSLGTEFTLVCPYTMLAHYDELDWAAGCGVDKHLIRISAGLEDYDVLEEALSKALAV